MGILIDEGKAATSPCTCFRIEPRGPDVPNNLLCFSPGIVGALSDKQDKQFCAILNIKESRGLQERFKRFKELGAINDVCLEKEVKPGEVGKCFTRGADLLDQGLTGKEFEEQLAEEFGVEVD